MWHGPIDILFTITGNGPLFACGWRLADPYVNVWKLLQLLLAHNNWSPNLATLYYHLITLMHSVVGCSDQAQQVGLSFLHEVWGLTTRMQKLEVMWLLWLSHLRGACTQGFSMWFGFLIPRCLKKSFVSYLETQSFKWKYCSMQKYCIVQGSCITLYDLEW